MKVTLLYYTGSPDPWRAADLMIFTKNTRTKMSPSGLEAISEWPEDKKLEELTYMANTIRSSWEFTDYVFLLEDVTRALTHQLVRTRHGSYAQQTQQVLKIDPADVKEPSNISPSVRAGWTAAVRQMAIGYQDMLEEGATIEQARGILPTNIHTNIVAKFNLRTLVEIFDQRISPRNLGEYRDVAEKMKQCVLLAHPWAKVFIEQSRDQYLSQLDEELKYLRDQTDRPTMVGAATRAMKLVDQLRRSREVQDD